MNASSTTKRGASPFSRSGLLAVIVVGFAAFIAMIYFIGSGDTGGGGEGGDAHAATDGLNGYAALADLLEANDYDVDMSRTRDGFDTPDLLILTPSRNTDAEEFTDILKKREDTGPTLVILPKWLALPVPQNVPQQDGQDVPSDWVRLGPATALSWTAQLPAPYTLDHQIETLGKDESVNWAGFDLRGQLPTGLVGYTSSRDGLEPVIIDSAGHALAVNVVGIDGQQYYDEAHWTLFVLEPDLMNNYGLSDGARASAALALVAEAGYGGDIRHVTFDLTQSGLGGSANLLTLAFQPPFLAATLCLILAMLIVGWRAFMRFGPTSAAQQEIAFGKQRLVTNGAGLIVRARRLRLLAQPYANLIERRLGKLLGIPRPNAEAIDTAIAVRMPDEEPYSSRAAKLNDADKPFEILRAAKALNDLTRKLSK